MKTKGFSHYLKRTFAALFCFCSFVASSVFAQDLKWPKPGNFGLPGIIDLPTARHFPDGELVLTQQLHRSLARSGISFQALPKVGVSFRYSGHGVGGGEAYGRFNHDRSFDAHLLVLSEGKYRPAISIGLRDFIGTGWYSSEYIVGTKSINRFDITAGLGFGRLAGRNSFSNPLKHLSSRFKERDINNVGGGGTLGTINWFQGNASAFYGLSYKMNKKTMISAEYTPDLMLREIRYLDIKSPWNFGISYKFNDYVTLEAQNLHGSQASLTAHITVNPDRPPLRGGKELAPVPLRLRGDPKATVQHSNESIIKKVLAADRFELHYLKIEGDFVIAVVSNTKFRSPAQALGRVASTLQRFTSDEVKFADISFYTGNLQVAGYRIDLEKITVEQTNPIAVKNNYSSIVPIDLPVVSLGEIQKRFTWGVGPYVTHRLFNPDLPLSMETGIEFSGGYEIARGLKLSSEIRKSVLTNLTKNKRLNSYSGLPTVHSDWPIYDLEGQKGHIHSLTLSYTKNLAPGFYGRTHAGLLEPFFAGVGAEFLYKPAKWPIALGVDIHRVRKRDYDMRFDLGTYSTTLGHFSVYYDAGGMFDVELNAGRYLAGDWGVTTTISRKFGSGWEIGGYATLTDVPFATFGEGSFDKAIYVSIPIDWIVSSPNRARRRLTLRPITRDGGANLSSARKLYYQIESSQTAQFEREFGRLWK